MKDGGVGALIAEVTITAMSPVIPAEEAADSKATPMPGRTEAGRYCERIPAAAAE